MKRVQVTDHFYLDELVDPAIYGALGARAVRLLDMRIVQGIEFLRAEELGDDHPVTINNWATAKPGQKVYKESGLRSFTTRTGATYSLHKYFRGFDLKAAGLTPMQLHARILKHEKYFIENQMITRMEDVKATPTWTHVDNAYTGKSFIEVFMP